MTPADRIRYCGPAVLDLEAEVERLRAVARVERHQPRQRSPLADKASVRGMP